MTEEIDKIFAVSLESTKRCKMYAAYDGSRLAITHYSLIVGPWSKWKEKLIAEIKDRSRKGFTVIIEDRSQMMCVGDASPFSFEDIEDGRSMLFHSLDWFFSMQAMGQIISAVKGVEQFFIHAGGEGQKIEKIQDERGRTIYRVDWSAVSGGTKAVLMCVSGAVMQPLSDKYFEKMYGPLSDESDATVNYDSTFRAMTKGIDESRIKKWDKLYND